MDGVSILVIDEGTTSTRAFVFAPSGASLACAQREIASVHPQPGWVEQDPDEIWEKSLACAREAIEAAGGAQGIAALGIANQRETILFWNRRTGKALAPAIVWQDRRTAGLCERLREAGHEAEVQACTGLLLDPYFSATKIAWALEHWPEVKAAGADLAIGTVESWLVYRLTGGLHISDATNASRTALMDLRSCRWDASLADLFGVPTAALPEIVDSTGRFGETRAEHFGRPIPICGLAGDQQAAAIGQACFHPGETKATFGTGAFVLTHLGSEMPRSRHRLLGTLAWRLGGVPAYALEGSIFMAGSLIQWLRDRLGVIGEAAEASALAASIPDSQGVIVLPAHGGLGAPHWLPDARGAILGLSHASGRAEIVRAALEAMAHQMHDLKTAAAADNAPWSRLKIDGGMSGSNWLAQDLADMLEIPVERPDFTETTALGAAMLARLGAGHVYSLPDAAVMRGETRGFVPHTQSEAREVRLARWHAALQSLEV